MVVVSPRKAKPGGVFACTSSPSRPGAAHAALGRVCSGDCPASHHAQGPLLLWWAGRERRLGSAGTGHHLAADPTA